MYIADYYCSNCKETVHGYNVQQGRRIEDKFCPLCKQKLESTADAFKRLERENEEMINVLLVVKMQLIHRRKNHQHKIIHYFR